MPSPAEPPGGGIPADRDRVKRRARWGLGILAALGGLALLVAGADPRSWLREALGAVERLGPWGPVLFVAVYILATVLALPGSVLTLGAGAVFGVVWGVVYVSVASTLGATGAFLIGRYLARAHVARWLAGHPTFGAIDRAVAEEGWRIVGLARLSPVLPFNVLNYGFGLTRVSLRDYVLASWIGMMPGTVMYVYLGSLVRAGLGNAGRSPVEWALYAGGLVATVAVAVLVTRRARKALARDTHVPADG